jgi:hypothetical protein
MAMANPLWRAPRIHGELKMLGILIGAERFSHSADDSPTASVSDVENVSE